MYKKLSKVQFPTPNNLMVNMMPIIMGDPESIPKELLGYLPLIDEVKFDIGSTVYLTVNESIVQSGSQRRGGVHTEGFKDERFQCFGGGNNFGGGIRMAWGGWGGVALNKGVAMASTDGRTRIWDSMTDNVNHHGALQHEALGKSEVMDPSTLYWMTDMTPHEALESVPGTPRQFFRLVADEVDVWWSQHNTANPLGVLPGAHVEMSSKF